MKTNNDTVPFSQKNRTTKKISQAGKSVGAAVGGAAIGMAASSFTMDGPEAEPEPSPEEPVQTEEIQESTSQVHNETEVEMETDSTPLPEPEVSEPTPEPAEEFVPETEPIPEAEPELIPEPELEPVMPVEEIDPQDNDVSDLIEDVSQVEVVYDVNGNPAAVMATAHNSVDGEFYLVDADMDGDFDVILDNMGNPVIELTGEHDRLITITDVEAKTTDGYIERNHIDDIIAQNDMIGEQIQNDIINLDEGIA